MNLANLSANLTHRIMYHTYTSNAVGVRTTFMPSLMICMARGSVGSIPPTIIGAVAFKLVSLMLAAMMLILLLCSLAGENPGTV